MECGDSKLIGDTIKSLQNERDALQKEYKSLKAKREFTQMEYDKQYNARVKRTDERAKVNGKVSSLRHEINDEEINGKESESSICDIRKRIEHLRNAMTLQTEIDKQNKDKIADEFMEMAEEFVNAAKVHKNAETLAKEIEKIEEMISGKSEIVEELKKKYENVFNEMKQYFTFEDTQQTKDVNDEIQQID